MTGVHEAKVKTEAAQSDIVRYLNALPASDSFSAEDAASE